MNMMKGNKTRHQNIEECQNIPMHSVQKKLYKRKVYSCSLLHKRAYKTFHMKISNTDLI